MKLSEKMDNTAGPASYWVDEVKELESENEALKKLAQHAPECPYSPQIIRGTHMNFHECTCGLVALLTGEDE